MATSDTELEVEVRSLTGHDEAVISTQDFETVISRAKSFIKNRRSLADSDVDWYGNPQAEEALFWGTCFFSKVKTGEVDGQNVSVGAIDLDTLLAKEDNELTTWLRNTLNAVRTLNPTGDFGIRGNSRTALGGEREYGSSEGDDGNTLV